MEEEYLRTKFGKVWQEWAVRTPMFLPRFKNFKPPALPFSMRSVLSKENHLIIVIILAFAFLEVVEELLAEHRFELDLGWTIAVAFGLIIWITLRVLKKKTAILNVEGR